VKEASGDHVVWRARAVEQPADFERVLDERGPVAAAALSGVLSMSVLERGSGLWKARYHIGQRPSTGHRKEAYANRANCEHIVAVSPSLPGYALARLSSTSAGGQPERGNQRPTSTTRDIAVKPRAPEFRPDFVMLV
jgi:hypothetical protein